LAFESHHALQQSAKTGKIESGMRQIESSHDFFACRHQIRIHSTYPGIRAIDSFEEAAVFAEQNESGCGSEVCLQSRQMQVKHSGTLLHINPGRR
jgi:hypothetical protein